jgi:cephalosporin hydroxylase
MSFWEGINVEFVEAARNKKMGSSHKLISYFKDYDFHFGQLDREKSYNILEIGVQRGGSIKLWHDYFENALVYGIDINSVENKSISNLPRVVLYEGMDAYDHIFFRNNILTNGHKFDFILDDGSHKLEDMKTFIQIYLDVLEEDGIMIIEDVKEMGWVESLGEVVPDIFKPYIEIYDLREGRSSDDIVFVINKTDKKGFA